MKRLLAILLMVCGAFAPVSAVWAEDLAVIIANEHYRNYPRFQNNPATAALESEFRNAGFSVIHIKNTKRDFTRGDTEALWRRMSQSDRLVVVLSGHIVNAGGETWLLHTDAGKVNAFDVAQDSLPIGAFVALASRHPGNAIVALAQTAQELLLGSGVAQGYRPETVPQGVTLLVGPPRQVRLFIANHALVPGSNLAAAANSMQNGFRAFGYLPRKRAFIENAVSGLDPALVERVMWEQARAADTVATYRDYVAQFPSGLHAGEARQRIDALQITPQERARRTEFGLNLRRDQREAIQRNLTLLGFDTAGIDGVFGTRTRRAITNWQRSLGLATTGYLNPNHIARLEIEATARAEQLRIEADRRRLERERKDRNYWQQTGASGSEAGLLAYLGKYPDGLFSRQAGDRLHEIERAKRRQAEAAERQAWDQAVIAGTLQSYREYLRVYPNGRFAEEARARERSLSNPETPRDIVEAAQAEEISLNLNKVTRHLIEGQLQRLSLDTGRVDGRFTNDTRRALRRFQRSNSIAVTGYVTRTTMVRLLATAMK